MLRPISGGCAQCRRSNLGVRCPLRAASSKPDEEARRGLGRHPLVSLPLARARSRLPFMPRLPLLPSNPSTSKAANVAPFAREKGPSHSRELASSGCMGRGLAIQSSAAWSAHAAISVRRAAKCVVTTVCDQNSQAADRSWTPHGVLLVQRQTTETHAYTHADTRSPHRTAHSHLTHVPHAANPRPGGGGGGQRASCAGQERRPRGCRRSREGAVACCGRAWLAAACRWSISLGDELEEGRGPGSAFLSHPSLPMGRAHHARKTAALPPHYHV